MSIRHAIRQRHGFTILEVVVASVILMIALAAASSAFMFIMRSETEGMHQADLDMAVKRAIARIKTKLRLSSLNEMLHYPIDGSELLAISFPTPATTNGAVILDTDGKILWGETVIYHGWPPELPTEFRETTFSPRLANHPDRQSQLQSVVVNGDASGILNEENASTRVIFRNLVDWNVRPISSVYEAYDAVGRADPDVYLGSTILQPGPHTLTFEATGRADAHSGSVMALGLDTVSVTPSYYPVEGESYMEDSSVVCDGSLTTLEPDSRIFSGHHVLSFTATDTGQTLQLPFYNDQYQECNFESGNGEHDHTMQEFRDSGDDDIVFSMLAVPSTITSDYVVRLRGMRDAWNAMDQTGDADGQSITNEVHEGMAARVILRGEQLNTGVNILDAGRRCRVLFRAGAVTGASLSIVEAFIAESAHDRILIPEVNVETITPLSFNQGAGESASATIPAGTALWSEYADLEIDPKAWTGE